MRKPWRPKKVLEILMSHGQGLGSWLCSAVTSSSGLSRSSWSSLRSSRTLFKLFSWQDQPSASCDTAPYTHKKGTQRLVCLSLLKPQHPHITIAKFLRGRSWGGTSRQHGSSVSPRSHQGHTHPASLLCLPRMSERPFLGLSYHLDSYPPQGSRITQSCTPHKAPPPSFSLSVPSREYDLC